MLAAVRGFEVHWLHADHLGSTRVITNTGGTAVRRIRYGVWGEIRSNQIVMGQPPTTPDSTAKYTGQKLDNALALYDYGARYYDPETATFVQPDPLIAGVFDPPALNAYAYVGNDPLSRIDPTGEAWGWFGSAARSFGSFVGGAFGRAATAALRPLTALGSTMQNAYRKITGQQPARAPVNAQTTPVPGAVQAGSSSARSSSSQGDPRALFATEQRYLEYITGESFAGIRVDEGFVGESFASGMVRSDREINVRTGFSSLDPREQLARLVHEGGHILQRREGTLNNFGGFFSHLGARLTGRNLYAIPARFRGRFSALNFEQQAVVLENAARIDLGLPIQNYGGELTNADYRLLYADFLTGR